MTETHHHFRIEGSGRGEGTSLPPRSTQPAAAKSPSYRQLCDLDAALRILEVKSIYELINCSPDDSQATLNENIKKFRARARLMPKVFAKAEASNKISCLLADFFANEASRKSFDEAWHNYLCQHKG